MLLKLDDPKILTESIAILSELVLEVKAKINSEGLSITALDPANVALITLKIPKEVFSQFDLEKEETLGLNLEDLKQVLRRAHAGSSLTLQKNDNLLNLEIQNKTKRNFTLSLIDIEQVDEKRQDLQFTSKIKIDSGIFSEAVSDAAIVADACSFVSTIDKFTIEAKGSLNQSKAEFSLKEAEIEANDARAKYSLGYLMKFIKASRLSSKVVVNFSSDYPLKLEFNDKIQLSFILAPRVEEED